MRFSSFCRSFWSLIVSKFWSSSLRPCIMAAVSVEAGSFADILKYQSIKILGHWDQKFTKRDGTQLEMIRPIMSEVVVARWRLGANLNIKLICHFDSTEKWIFFATILTFLNKIGKSVSNGKIEFSSEKRYQ